MKRIASLALVGMALFGAVPASTFAQEFRPNPSASAVGDLVFERASRKQREQAAAIIVSQLDDAGIGVRFENYDLGKLDLGKGRIVELSGSNIVAEIEATEPGAQTVVIGAHYDSVRGSPGADDNASGTYAVIELAKRVSAMPVRNMTVLFVWFDQEEVGLIGSKVFAARLESKSVALHSMHNIDMIGFDGNHDGRFDLDVPDGELAQAYLAQAARLGIPIARAQFDGSDHASFRAWGYRSVCLSQDFSNKDINPAYHRTGDDRIDVRYMQSGIELVWAVTQQLLTGTGS